MKSAKERLIEIKEKLYQYHLQKEQSVEPKIQNPVFKTTIGNVIKTADNEEIRASDQSDIIVQETEDNIVVTNRAQLQKESIELDKSWQKKHTSHSTKPKRKKKDDPEVLKVLRNEVVKYRRGSFLANDISRHNPDDYMFAPSLVPCNSFVHSLGSDLSYTYGRNKFSDDN